MFIANLQQHDDAVMLQLPRELLARLRLRAGQTVALEAVGNSVVLRAHVVAPYTLAEMLDECDFSLPISDEERQWQDTPPVGQELL